MKDRVYLFKYTNQLIGVLITCSRWVSLALMIVANYLIDYCIIFSPFILPPDWISEPMPQLRFFLCVAVVDSKALNHERFVLCQKCFMRFYWTTKSENLTLFCLVKNDVCFLQRPRGIYSMRQLCW